MAALTNGDKAGPPPGVKRGDSGGWSDPKDSKSSGSSKGK
jgi:hypothetical protein